MSARVMVLAVGLVWVAAAACGSADRSADPTTGPEASDAPLFRNPVALQLWSLRDSFEKQGVPATLAKVRPMGISHVELAGTHGLARDAFKAELDRAGLTPVSMHVDITALVKDPTPFIDDAKVYGVRHVGAAWFPHEGTFDAADAEQAIAAFNTAGRALRAAGLSFFYHAHGYEFAPAPGGGTLFDLIAAGTDPDAVKFQLDAFWVWHGGVEPAVLLARYPSRFISTHLKDMRSGTPRNFTGSAPENSSVALGTGVVDLVPLVEGARGSAVEWHIIEEESSDPETNIPAGLAWVRQLEARQQQ